jgi:hypothetical protein
MFNMKFKFKLDSKNLDSKDLGEEIKKEVANKISDATNQAINSIVCPEHGLKAYIVNNGGSWKIQGCCQKLIDSVLKNLKNTLQNKSDSWVLLYFVQFSHYHI